MFEKKDITFNISKHLVTFSTKDTGWAKEMNIVSWNGGKEKIDIREWDPDHKFCGKGITLTEAEARMMYETLGKLIHTDEEELPFGPDNSEENIDI